MVTRMNWSRVKSLLIGLLLTVNIILAFIWAYREYTLYRQDRESEDRISVLLLQNGLDTEGIKLPKTLTYTYDLAADPEREAEAAATALGSAINREDNGGVTRLFNENGYAELRISGDREIQAQNKGITLGAFARELGLLEGETEPEADTILELTQTVAGLPVFNHVMILEYADTYLRASGRWALGDAKPVNAGKCYSAAYCLLAMTSSWQDNGTLEKAELGFRSGAIASDTLRLTPYWRFTVSGRVYEVNAASGKYEGQIAKMDFDEEYNAP